MEQSPGAESPWISLLLAAPWSQPTRLVPSLHVSLKEKVALETQMQFADFSKNAVEMILIPGSTGKIKRAREALLDMEWK